MYVYQRLIVPTVIYISKDKLDNYNYIKTIRAGHGSAHIISGGNYYYICLRNDDNIAFDSETNEPFGFRRNSIQECEKLSTTFNIAADKEIKKRAKFICPPLDEDSVLQQIP